MNNTGMEQLCKASEDRESVRLNGQFDAALENLEMAISDIEDKITIFCIGRHEADEPKKDAAVPILSPYAEGLTKRIERINTAAAYLREMLHRLRF